MRHVGTLNRSITRFGSLTRLWGLWQMEEIEQIQQAFWNADFMKVEVRNLLPRQL